jgi:hypothetical protein
MKTVSKVAIAAPFLLLGASAFAAVAAAGPVTATVCKAGACAPIPVPVAVALIAAPIVIGNVQAAGRESGLPAQVLRATLGISARDIQQYGIWGGQCSFFRRPLGC